MITAAATVASGTVQQGILRESVKVPRYDPQMEHLCWAIADDSTMRSPIVYPKTTYPQALSCGRELCRTVAGFVAQGHPDGPLLLLCPGCGSSWTPLWDGYWKLDADPEEFNRGLLATALNDTGAPITELASAVRALRNAAAAGTWRPTRSDGDFAWTWRYWGRQAVTVRELRHAMWIEGSHQRSPELSALLARSIGLLLLPEADQLGQARPVGEELVALAAVLEQP